MTYSFKKACAFSLVAFLAFGQAMASDEKEALREEASSSSPSSSSGQSIVIPEFAKTELYRALTVNAESGNPRLMNFDLITDVSRVAVLKGASCKDAVHSFLEAAARQDVKEGTVETLKSASLLEAVVSQIAPGVDRVLAFTYAQSLCVKGSDDFDGMITLLQAVVRVPVSLGLINTVPHRLPVIQTILLTAPADNSFMPAKEQCLARGQALIQLSVTIQNELRKSTFEFFTTKIAAHAPTVPAATEPTPSSSSSSTLLPVSSDAPAQDADKASDE